MVKKCLMTTALILAMTWAGSAQNASTLISDASKAIGADTVKTLQYSGPAAESNFGQAYTNGGLWPAWKIKTYTRTVDFGARAIKIVRVAEPRDANGHVLLLNSDDDSGSSEGASGLRPCGQATRDRA